MKKCVIPLATTTKEYLGSVASRWEWIGEMGDFVSGNIFQRGCKIMPKGERHQQKYQLIANNDCS